MFNLTTSIVEESIHVVFDKTRSQKMKKDSSSFDFSDVLTEDLVNDNDLKEDPS